MTMTLYPPELVDQLTQIAEAEGKSSEELLIQAVNEFLAKVANQKLRTEGEAFKAMYPQLLENYQGDYVAIHHGQLVDYDKDARALYLRIRQQYGRITVLIRQVTDQIEPVLTLRSPRLMSVNHEI